MNASRTLVKTGLDILVDEEMRRLRGLKVALLGNPASVDSDYVHLLDRCIEHDVKLVRLFGPEHGLLGDAQYMEEVGRMQDPRTSLDVLSLYGATRDSLFLNPKDLEGVDVLVADLQDIGTRYYTFAYTIAFALRACARASVRCIVLDRPNPIGGLAVEGNLVREPFRSFVGEYSLANRHGLTLGELCSFFQAHDGHAADVDVVWSKGWTRDLHHDDTTASWVMPSPNMPTVDTALVYPGACLFEGTNVSEGRGTTRPFELLGAPFIDPHAWIDRTLQLGHLPGIQLRPCFFRPTFDKFRGELCGGVQVHVVDRHAFQPLLTYVALLFSARSFRGFAWRTTPYEYVSDRLAIDLLFGDDQPRLLMEQGAAFDDVMAHLRADTEAVIDLHQRFHHPGYAPVASSMQTC